MAFREVRVHEVREVLRQWLGDGLGLRPIAERAGVDRKTARRYVDAAVAVGLVRDGGVQQLTDELIGAVIAAVRPDRAQGHGAAWDSLLVHEQQLRKWIGADGLQLTNIHGKLARRGVVVPYRTLHRFAVERCGFGQRTATVRVADGTPGMECQLDFGRLGMMLDPVTGRRRAVHALIFTAVYSRHLFVWLCFTQTLADVIAGCEAAWRYFGGVFKVLIPDNLKPVVANADPINPTFTVGWLDYAQARGFGTDPARVRSPKDKPRVERVVQYVRGNFFAGESFADLADAQRRVELWCRSTAGLRVHGTTAQRPAEHFAAEEQSLLLPLPAPPYDVPVFATPKVAPDRHVRDRAGVVLGAGRVDRAAGPGPRRQPPGEDLRPRAADQDPPAQTTRWPVHRPGRLPGRPGRIRAAGRRDLEEEGCGGRGRPSVCTRPGCWTCRCRGPACAPSIGCSG